MEGLNEALLAKAAEVPANVCYPTDSGLLAKAVRRIAATGRRIQAAGGATRTRIPSRCPTSTLALRPPARRAEG